MAEQDPVVVATGTEDVRAYLREQGMTDADISKYMDDTRSGPEPARFSFSADDAGLIRRYTLSYAGEMFILIEQKV